MFQDFLLTEELRIEFSISESLFFKDLNSVSISSLSLSISFSRKPLTKLSISFALRHIMIFVFSGIFGMKLMIDALKFACEKKDIYPRTGVSVFRIWMIILAFVGIQIAWNLRPFLCNKTEEFKLFRKYEGNFYTAIIYSVQQLAKPDERESSFEVRPETQEQVTDTVLLNLIKK